MPKAIPDVNHACFLLFIEFHQPSSEVTMPPTCHSLKVVSDTLRFTLIIIFDPSGQFPRRLGYVNFQIPPSSMGSWC